MFRTKATDTEQVSQTKVLAVNLWTVARLTAKRARMSVVRIMILKDAKYGSGTTGNCMW